jgi:hypothetical protein
MTFIGRLFERLHPRPQESPSGKIDTRADAVRAIERARRDLELVNRQEPLVAAVVKASENQLLRNHFAELIEKTMRGVG